MIDALAKAGAGQIGDYDRAAWSGLGEGTFRPLEGANPTIGQVGDIEVVPERRLEMILPRATAGPSSRRWSPRIPMRAGLRPLRVAQLPSERGGGRVGLLPEPLPLADFARLVAESLPQTEHGVRVSGDLEADDRDRRCGRRSGDSEFERVRAAGVDAYLTADLRHHPATEARAYDEGPALIDVAHWASEWPWLADAERLLLDGLAAQGSTPGSTVDTHISTLCTDAWTLRI
jgi:putative NIF3 family GTP cyclohydrolase 1 type 2